MRLDVSTVCQLKCPLCPNARGIIEKTVGKGFLRFDHFEKLLKRNPQIRLVELSNWGEIFLNPEIVHILRFAFRHGVALSAFNGANFNDVSEVILDALVRYEFLFLSLSVDGAKSDTYAQYRVGGNFHKVMENIRRLNHFKQKAGSPYPILQWQMVVFDHNRNEIEAARKMASMFHMLFTTKPNWQKFPSQISEMKTSAPETNDGHFSGNQRPYHRRSCYQLWNEPQVNWDGRVLGCCENGWFDFGANAIEEGFLGSVNTEKMVYAREMLLGQSPPKENIPCTHCPKYAHMQAANRYLDKTEIYLDRIRGFELFLKLFKTPLFHRFFNSSMRYGHHLLRKKALDLMDLPFQ